MNYFTKEGLSRLYLEEGKSVHDIASLYSCSQNKINYWFSKFNIKKRTISEAIYQKSNPNGNPFFFKTPKKPDDVFLFGLGLGLYWGEGNKKNTNTVRLGNTDPRLVKSFIKFLEHIYAVPKEKFRFGLQIFSDMRPQKALQFWMSALNVPRDKFGKVIVTPARSIGTYKEKSKYGVLTIYVSNKKLRDLLIDEIEKL